MMQIQPPIQPPFQDPLQESSITDTNMDITKYVYDKYDDALIDVMTLQSKVSKFEELMQPDYKLHTEIDSLIKKLTPSLNQTETPGSQGYDVNYLIDKNDCSGENAVKCNELINTIYTSVVTMKTIVSEDDPRQNIYDYALLALQNHKEKINYLNGSPGMSSRPPIPPQMRGPPGMPPQMGGRRKSKKRKTKKGKKGRRMTKRGGQKVLDLARAYDANVERAAQIMTTVDREEMIRDIQREKQRQHTKSERDLQDDEEEYQQRLVESCGKQPMQYDLSWKTLDLVKETQDLRKNMVKQIMDLKSSIASDDRKKDMSFSKTKNTLCRILTKMTSFQIRYIPACTPGLVSGSKKYVMRYNFGSGESNDEEKIQVCQIDKTTFYGLIREYISIIEEVLYSYPQKDLQDNDASRLANDFENAISKQLRILNTLKNNVKRKELKHARKITGEYSEYQNKIEPYISEYRNQNQTIGSQSQQPEKPEWLDVMKTARIRLSQEYPRGIEPILSESETSEIENRVRNYQTNIKEDYKTGSDFGNKKKPQTEEEIIDTMLSVIPTKKDRKQAINAAKEASNIKQTNYVDELKNSISAIQEENRIKGENESTQNMFGEMKNLIDIKKEINKELGRITDKAQRSTRKTDLKNQALEASEKSGRSPLIEMHNALFDSTGGMKSRRTKKYRHKRNRKTRKSRKTKKTKKSRKSKK